MGEAINEPRRHACSIYGHNSFSKAFVIYDPPGLTALAATSKKPPICLVSRCGGFFFSITKESANLVLF
jgi:hypothetical protein